MITGGGTGGHIYPALAIAKGLFSRYPKTKVLYIGTPGGMEAELVPREGIDFHPVVSEGWNRRLSWQIPLLGIRLSQGILQAWSVLGKFKPHVVVGTGGFVCGPVVLAAALRGIPIVLHEQNAWPGLTNRYLSRLAQAVCLTFPEASQYLSRKDHLHTTGMPVREEISAIPRQEGAKKLNLDPGLFSLLVVGGSRGARSINKAVIKLAKEIQGRPGIQLLHVTGKAGYGDMLAWMAEAGITLAENGNITIVPYIYQMENALAAADLVVSRAGAAFISELLICGRPSILVPYPHAAENHQEYNARVLEKEKAAVVILDKELDGNSLCREVFHLMERPELLREMGDKAKALAKPHALNSILEIIKQVEKEHRVRKFRQAFKMN
ncbi:MAG: undecaprenyldiphospho-muramoylpentapeptide beta-N-acetylglucosaminyltransferase [Bacillota bacterium]